MSQEAARALVERMKDDEAFREEVLSAEDAAARLVIVNAEGFDCSAEEIEAQGRRLNDLELEEVAAAGYDCPCLNDAIHGQAHTG